MTVIAEFRVPSCDFELGRILAVDSASAVELESLVPVGEATVPLFWVYNASRESFVERVRSHPGVDGVTPVDVFEDRMLFTLDWDANRDHLFGGIDEHDGQLLSATGTPETWEFEMRFPDYDALSEFTTHCRETSTPLAVARVYDPTDGDAERWHGLTEPQRKALTLAVEKGYYDIPRGCSTVELAADLGISDQAATERLRRAIAALVSHTLPTSEFGTDDSQ